MAEERADALIQLGADDVLELASLGVHFGFVDRKRVLEESLGETMAAHDVACALAPHGRELRFSVSKIHEMQFRHAAQNPCRWFVGCKWETSTRAGRVEASDMRGPFFLAADPDLLEEVIEANLVVS